MGLFDSVSNVLNRGTNIADRTARKVRLDARLREIARERQNYAAQLGALVYEETKANPAARAGREELYDGITRLDDERERVSAQISALEEEERQEQQAWVNQSQDVAAAPQTPDAPELRACSNCGAVLEAADRFCGSCGAPVAPAAQTASAPGTQTGQAPVPPPQAGESQ